MFTESKGDRLHGYFSCYNVQYSYVRELKKEMKIDVNKILM